jgi:hypothetical protein
MTNYDFDVITGPSAPPVKAPAAWSSRLLVDPGRPAALSDADAGTLPGCLALPPHGSGVTGKLQPTHG